MSHQNGSLVPTLRVGTDKPRRSASAVVRVADAERRKKWVPTQSMGTRRKAFVELRAWVVHAALCVLAVRPLSRRQFPNDRNRSKV